MRVALIGLGHAAQDLHLPALRALADADAVGGFDVNADTRARIQEEWDLPSYPDADALLGACDPDVVVVGTPPDSHLEYCVRALRAGCHVICEKPFASSVAQAERVIEASAQTGRQVALNHEFREMPIFRAVLKAEGTTGVGRVRFTQIRQNMDLPPWEEPNWRSQLLERTLFEAGIHLLDFLVCLYGEVPTAVSATTSSCGARAEASDALALVTLEFSGGRVAHVVQNRLCKGETQYFEVRADAEGASLRASFGGRARLSLGLYRSKTPHARIEFGPAGVAWKEVGNHRTTLARNPLQPGREATRSVFEQTLAAFRQESEPPVTPELGRDVLAVAAAAYLSAEKGCRVNVDTESSALRNFTMGDAATHAAEG